ncbi:hypothetical protein LguiA_035184 [Lonicera macranthoides]
MKLSVFATAIVLSLVLFLPTIISSARHIAPKHSRHGHHHTTTTVVGDASKTEEGAGLMSSKWKTQAIAGSTLPDCSHACGSCSPCRLVMVSFVCASIEEAESCPVAYRCMCKNKSYPVP